MTTAYITKYALTGKDAGRAMTVNGKVRKTYESFGDDREYFECVLDGNAWKQNLLIGRDAFLNKSDALADIKKRRDKKVASLTAQIAKLQAIKIV